MDTTQTPTQSVSTTPPPRKWPKRLAIGAAFAAVFGIGIGTGSASHTTTTVTHTVTKTVTLPGKTVTKTVTIPGPTKTVIKAVPGPTKTVTAAPPAASAPAAGSTLLDFSGSGTQQTPSFTSSSSGDYTVSWTFSGNDTQVPGGDNFIMQEDGGSDVNALSLPNVIQTSGQGSTGVTGDTGSHSFNVTADQGSSWTIKVISAP